MKKKVTESINLTDSQRLSVKRTAEITNRVAAALLGVMPDADPDLIDTVACDLGDFWEISLNHIARVNQILQLQGPQDQKRLAELLTELYYGDLKAHLPNHLESMEEVMPALMKILEPGTDRK